AHAHVAVLDSGGTVVAAALTDGDGRYRIDDLPAGDYTVVGRGYPPASARVAVDGERIAHDLRLCYDGAADRS
ncbi:carboxypeptidase regulatory-like domain-containing protein, partial [Nocardia nova]